MAQSVKYSMDEDLLIDADEYKRVYNKLSKETRNDLASFYGHEFDEGGYEEGELIEGHFDQAVKYYKYSDDNAAPKDLVQRNEFSILGLMVLVLTIVGGASTFPFQTIIPFTNDLIKLLWRNQALFLILLPFGIYEYKKDQQLYLYKIIRYSNAFHVLKASLFQTIWLVSLFWAMNCTNFPHACYFSNFTSLYIIAWKKWKRYEFFGTGITMLGGILTMLDPILITTGSIKTYSIKGDFIALAGSVFGAMFLIEASRAIKKIPIFIFLTSFAFTNIIFSYFAASLFTQVNFSFNSKIGAFGWINLHLFMYVLVFGGLLAGFMANAGYVNSLKYYCPLVVANVIMFEPVGSQLFEYALKMGGIGWMTIFCGLGILIGTAFVVKGFNLRKQIAVYGQPESELLRMKDFAPRLSDSNQYISNNNQNIDKFKI